MSNPLSNGALWKDETGHSPPSYWNGTNFEFFNLPNDGSVPVGSITYIGPQVITPSTYIVDIVEVGADVANVYVQIVVNGTVFTGSSPLPEFTTCVFNLFASASGGCCDYSLDVVVAANAPTSPHFWQDNVGCTETH